MSGSSGWRADLEYDRWEDEVRSMAPEDRTEVEQRYLDSCDEMEIARLEVQNSVASSILRVLIVWMVLGPIIYLGWKALTNWHHSAYYKLSTGLMLVDSTFLLRFENSKKLQELRLTQTESHGNIKLVYWNTLHICVQGIFVLEYVYEKELL